MASDRFQFSIIPDEYPELYGWLCSHPRGSFSRNVCQLLARGLECQDSTTADLGEIRAVIDAALDAKLAGLSLPAEGSATPTPVTSGQTDPLADFDSLIG